MKLESIEDVTGEVPEWFLNTFQANSRLCLPYALSIRALDDILISSNSDKISIHGGLLEEFEKEFDVDSGVEFAEIVHSEIYANAPADAIVTVSEGSWLYFDGDQRFSCFISSTSTISKAFRNTLEVMRWYFVQNSEDLDRDDQENKFLFDVITAM